jgi:hypothetical protein
VEVDDGVVMYMPFYVSSDSFTRDSATASDVPQQTRSATTWSWKTFHKNTHFNHPDRLTSDLYHCPTPPLLTRQDSFFPSRSTVLHGKDYKDEGAEFVFHAKHGMKGTFRLCTVISGAVKSEQVFGLALLSEWIAQDRTSRGQSLYTISPWIIARGLYSEEQRNLNKATLMERLSKIGQERPRADPDIEFVFYERIRGPAYVDEDTSKLRTKLRWVQKWWKPEDFNSCTWHLHNGDMCFNSVYLRTVATVSKPYRDFDSNQFQPGSTATILRTFFSALNGVGFGECDAFVVK